MDEVKYIEEDLREIDGNKFYLHPKNEHHTLLRAMCVQIRGGRPWEPHVCNVLKKYSDKRRTAIDVGASIGVLAIPLARWNKKVIAFEPEDISFNLLQKNVELNNIKNMIISNKGLGSENKRAALNIADGTIERGSPANNIEVVHGDEELKRLGMSSRVIGLIKIDAESYEDEVLIGLAGTIQKFKPYIYLETHEDRRYQVNSKDGAYEFMKRNNYELIVGGDVEFGKDNGLWECKKK
jgi:FkbM family methyltransferase